MNPNCLGMKKIKKYPTTKKFSLDQPEIGPSKKQMGCTHIPLTKHMKSKITFKLGRACTRRTKTRIINTRKNIFDFRRVTIQPQLHEKILMWEEEKICRIWTPVLCHSIYPWFSSLEEIRKFGFHERKSNPGMFGTGCYSGEDITKHLPKDDFIYILMTCLFGEASQKDWTTWLWLTWNTHHSLTLRTKFFQVSTNGKYTLVSTSRKNENSMEL